MIEPSTALVLGSTGAIGSALQAALAQAAQHTQVLGLSRQSAPALDLLDEASIERSADWVASQTADAPLRTLVVATGSLHSAQGMPEKSVSQLNAAYLQHQFAANVIGPMLVMKHIFKLLPSRGPVRIAFLSAKVGSIGHNALGGWYGYRSAKAALNQAVKTASIELTRRNKQSVCIALHPGTVASALSAPFGKTGLNVREPAVAAAALLQVLQNLKPEDTGALMNHDGTHLPW